MPRTTRRRPASQKTATNITSSVIDSAAPNGGFRAARNCCSITFPISGLLRPPRMSLIANCPTAGTNTSSTPAMMPGRVSGTITFQNARTGLAPRSNAASIIAPSSFSTLP